MSLISGEPGGGETLPMSDNFDDGNDDGWTRESGNWSVVNGEYRHDNNGDGFSSRGNTAWTDYEMEFVFVNCKDGGVLVRASDMNNGIALIVRPVYDDIYWHVRQNGGWGSQYNSVSLGYSSGSTLTVKVVAQGNHFTAYVNGQQKTTFSSSTFPNGKVVLYAFQGQSGQAFDDVSVTAVGATKPIVSNFEDDRLTFSIMQNTPNPFNPETAIAYSLPQDIEVSLIVYNVLGQPVRTLVNTHKTAGHYRAIWDSRDDFGHQVASGIYLYRIVAGDFVDTKKMLILK